MSLSVGDKLGPYEILGPLGAGGMGEVWKARDLRLGRIVAIKVSQGNFTDRFEREAKAVAALNHPNVCQLYDVGSVDGIGYLVMELVEGSPIAAVDSPRKLLDLAVQIADGLSAAHVVSIVHRDLKPDNILLTREGRVKILDFGLARLSAAAASAGDQTRTLSLTDPGTTVGTVNYMSPEQARGEKDLTPQSDQFSFGLVLYELSTGTRPFRRASAAETMVAIIREQAEPLPALVPAPLRWVIERLLAKDPSERYDSTRDLYRELKQIRDRLSDGVSVVQAEPAVRPKRKRLPVPVLIGAASLIAGAAGAMLLLPQSTAGPDLENYKYTPITQDGTEHRSVQWSPDGKNLAYTQRVNGRMQVFTRLLDGSDGVQLSKAGRDCTGPFWSPDSATVYYVSGGSLWSIPAAGGAAQMVFEGVDFAAIHPDGTTVALQHGGKIWIRSLNGGEEREFWPGPADSSFGFRFSPDGSKLAAAISGGIWVLPYPSGTPRQLEAIGIFTLPSWFPDSRHLVVSVHFADTHKSMLSILDVVDGNRRTIASDPAGMNYPAVSPDGKRIAYGSGKVGWDVVEVSIPGGDIRTLVSGVGSWWPDWAPSGTHFIYSVPLRGRIDDRQAGEEGFSRQLVQGASADPRWSPDGKRIAFESQAGLAMVNASGGGLVLLNAGDSHSGISWSPDGLWISYLRSARGKIEVVKMRATPGGDTVALTAINSQVNLRRGTRWSPAGDWIAYPTAEGIDLISPDGRSTRTLSKRAFATFGFSRDGAQIYGIFRNTSGQGAPWQVFSVDVKTDAERFLAPVDLPASADTLAGFSIHPDGKRFLTSFSKFPFDIWVLEGFPPPRTRTRLERMLDR